MKLKEVHEERWARTPLVDGTGVVLSPSHHIQHKTCSTLVHTLSHTAPTRQGTVIDNWFFPLLPAPWGHLPLSSPPGRLFPFATLPLRDYPALPLPTCATASSSFLCCCAMAARTAGP